jgi:integrase
LAEFSQRFFEWLLGIQLEEKSKKYYKHGYKVLATTPLVNMRLDALSTDEIASVRFPGSPSNQNCALRTLRHMLGKAQSWSIIGVAPRVKLVKEHGRDRLLDAEMERKLLEVAPQPLRDVLLIVLDAGMRPNEVFRLRWEHVDFASRTMFNPTGKTAKARRWVPMSIRIMDALKARGPQASGWVFPSKRAKCGHLTTVAEQFRLARKLAGLPKDVVLYCGRHTFGTEMLRRTGNLAAVMKVMGHSSANTAMIYQHPELVDIRDAVDARNDNNNKAARMVM